MSEDKTTLDENEKSTPIETDESDDASEFESLFSEEEDENSPVNRQEYENLKKGIQKLATELGKLKKGNVEAKPTPAKDDMAETIPVGGSAILKKLYAKDNPEILEVWDEIVKEAPKGVDPIEYYESKKGWQLEAKARYDAKKEEETNKSKIDKPTDGIVSNKKIDISKVEAEDVSKLSPSQKIEWINAQAELERNNDA